MSPFLLSCAYRESARGALGIRLKSEDGLDVAAAPPPSDSGNASPSNDNGNVSPASLVPFGDGGGQELALGDRAFPQWHGEQQQQELWEEKRREETVGSTVLGLPRGGVSEPPAAVALVDHPTQASILIRSDDENAVAEPRRTVAGTILGSADSAMTRAVVPSTKEHHDERVRGTETVVESLPSSETTGAGSGDSTEGGRASSDAFMLRPLHPTPTFSPGRMHSGVGRAGVGGGGVQAGLYGDVRDTGFEPEELVAATRAANSAAAAAAKRQAKLAAARAKHRVVKQQSGRRLVTGASFKGRQGIRGLGALDVVGLGQLGEHELYREASDRSGSSSSIGSVTSGCSVSSRSRLDAARAKHEAAKRQAVHLKEILLGGGGDLAHNLDSTDNGSGGGVVSPASEVGDPARDDDVGTSRLGFAGLISAKLGGENNSSTNSKDKHRKNDSNSTVTNMSLEVSTSSRDGSSTDSGFEDGLTGEALGRGVGPVRHQSVGARPKEGTRGLVDRPEREVAVSASLPERFLAGMVARLLGEGDVGAVPRGGAADSLHQVGVDADRENDGHCDGSDNGGGENARGRDVGPAMLADPSVPSETRAVDVTAAANGVSNELAETTTADHRNSDESKTRPLSDESSLADPTSDARTRDSALHADDFNIRRQIIPPAPSLIVEVDSSSNDRLTAASASGGEQEAHEDDVVVPSLNQKHELIPDVGRPHNQQEAAGQISRKHVLSASVLSTVTSVSSSIVSSTVGIVVPDVPAVGSMTTTPSLGLSGSLPVGSDMSVKTSNVSGEGTTGVRVISDVGLKNV